MLGVFLISTRQTPGKGGMIIAKELIRRKQVKGVKIAVIGYSGAGKSTLAKKLGKLFRCPVLHLDRIQFEPGWKERDRETAKRIFWMKMKTEAGSLTEIIRDSVRSAG